MSDLQEEICRLEKVVESLVISNERNSSSIGRFEQNGIPGVRDFFATSALSALANAAHYHRFDAAGFAKHAYEVADAMMAEREKNATTK